MDARDFENAGLYDPGSPRAAERLELLEWLAARGIAIEQMVAADRVGALAGVAGWQHLRPGLNVSLSDLAQRLGLPVETVEGFYLATGMSPAPHHVPVFTEEEAGMFCRLPEGIELMGASEMRRMLQVVSVSLAAIGEAAVSGTIAKSWSESELAQAKASLRATETIGALGELLTLMLRLHIFVAGAKLRGALRSSDAVPTFRFAVGFVDLAGFTSLSRSISYAELDRLVDRFEALATDIATTRGGRVVKFVGDEVMFVSEDVDAACNIALALLEAFADDPQVKPRAGIAYGDLLVRAGDYCGPIVNLASRLAELAVRREVLVTNEVAETCRGNALRFEPAGRRMVRGFDEPVRVLNVTRAP